MALSAEARAAPWTPGEGRRGFRELGLWEVPADVRRAAATMCEMVAADLGLPDGIAVRWYVDDHAETGFAHWTQPGVIWVHKTTHYREAMRTVAHELVHIFQFRIGVKGAGGCLRGALDADAEEYAGQAIAWFRDA